MLGAENIPSSSMGLVGAVSSSTNQIGGGIEGGGISSLNSGIIPGPGGATTNYPPGGLSSSSTHGGAAVVLDPMTDMLFGTGIQEQLSSSPSTGTGGIVFEYFLVLTCLLPLAAFSFSCH